MPCCRHQYVAGEWFFPNGLMVKMMGSSFIRNRGRDGGTSDGTVNLNRLGDAMFPTGLFCCVVPDATDITQTLCARIGECVDTFICLHS